MLTIQLDVGAGINNSLQIGDMIYASAIQTQAGASDPQAGNANSLGIGVNQLVGILRDISVGSVITLLIDNTSGKLPPNVYTPILGDFIMFSKYTQGDSGVLGYYAEAKFANNSTEKAELFAVSSEVIINSK